MPLDAHGVLSPEHGTSELATGVPVDRANRHRHLELAYLDVDAVDEDDLGPLGAFLDEGDPEAVLDQGWNQVSKAKRTSGEPGNEDDGVTVVDTDTWNVWVENTTDNEETYYLLLENNDTTYPGVYVLLLSFYGYDNDEDGYYTRDWDTSRDCDDTNASITACP